MTYYIYLLNASNWTSFVFSFFSYLIRLLATNNAWKRALINLIIICYSICPIIVIVTVEKKEYLDSSGSNKVRKKSFQFRVGLWKFIIKGNYFFHLTFLHFYYWTTKNAPQYLPWLYLGKSRERGENIVTRGSAMAWGQPTYTTIFCSKPA